MIAADWLRLALMMAWGLTIVISVAVVLTYNDLRRNSTDIRNTAGNLRFLSQHVVYIGSSYIVSVTVNAYQVFSGFGHPVDGWMWALSFVLATGCIGLVMVLRFQFTRLRDRGGEDARTR